MIGRDTAPGRGCPPGLVPHDSHTEEVEPVKTTSRRPLTDRFRAAVAGGALALGMLALTGCGAAGSPGVAAVTNGQAVTESMVDDVMADFEKVGAGGQIQRGTVVAMLAMRPVIMDVGAQSGAALGEEAVRAALRDQVPNVSDATVAFQQTQSTAGALTQDQLPTFEQRLQSADIEVSPRYGSFDPQQGFVPSNPNWLQPAMPAMGDIPPGHP